MNEYRCGLVMKAFKKLDADKNGSIQLNDIKKFYNAKLAPDVLSRKKTEDEVLADFLGSFDSIDKDGIVTYEEFLNYYNGVSVSIDRDDYFALMMQNAWKIDV
jgi:Ca2+-binding EF-hand superfamily protein